MSLFPINAASALSPLSMMSALATKAKASASGTTTSTTTPTTGGGLSSTTTGTTFLNLLVKELQNQDPSAPMDSTAMVGQMISLNQLDQLISINQVLAGTATSTTPTTASSSSARSSSASSSSADLLAQRADLLNTASKQSQTQAAIAAASDPNSILNFSSLNVPLGGK